MKHIRTLILTFASLVPLTLSGQALAQDAPNTTDSTNTITQELKVTAIVPDRRDVVIDLRGQIVSVTSNTPNDVEPQVYLLSVAPDNKQALTPELLQQYREIVPVGTAEYGVLFESNRPVAQANQSFTFLSIFGRS